MKLFRTSAKVVIFTNITDAEAESTNRMPFRTDQFVQ